MNKGMFFLAGITLILLGIMFFGDVNYWVILGIIIFINFIFYIMMFGYLIFTRPKILSCLKNGYKLEILDNIDGDVYVIKDCNAYRYVFSYLNENGKKVTCLESNVEIENTDEKPYLEIYSKEYKNKGLLDFLFFPIEMQKDKNKLVYVLHVNENMIKCNN